MVFVFLTKRIKMLKKLSISILLAMSFGRINGMEHQLHKAILAGETDLAQALIISGADLEELDENGVSPLCYAVSPFEKKGTIVQTLIAHGANVNGLDIADYQTPLHSAVSYGNIEAATSLCRAGADPEKSWGGHTPLSLAITRNNGPMIQLLVDHNEIMLNARKQTKANFDVALLATHARVGADSPLAFLSQNVWENIGRLVNQEYVRDAYHQ